MMNENRCVELLARHGIRPTSNRIVVLKALAAEERPVSITDLENSILTIDKSGIFRTLVVFREHHLVHVVEDGEGGVKYELCFSHNEAEDEDTHVHFYCMECHRLFCLFDTSIPAVDVPEGYVLQTTNYLLRGLCPECAAKKSGL